MRLALRLAITWIVILAITATAVIWLLSREVRVEAYPTLAAARAAGAIERGWIPTWLPGSARNLREAHDLDTNARWLHLEANPEDWFGVLEAQWRERLLPIAQDSVAAYVTAPPRALAALWPQQLTEAPVHRPREWRFVELYRLDEERYCLAIDWRTGRGWGWSCEAAG